MNNRSYWKNRMPPVGRSRRFTPSSTRTAPQKYEIKTRGKPTHDPNKSSLLNIDDKCMETTSSVKDDKEICAVKSLMNCANVSTVAVESRKKSAANLETSDRKCHTARSVLESQVVGSVNSNIKKAKNKISKHSNDLKKAIRCTINEITRHNSSTSNYEAVEPKNSSTMTTLSDPNSLPCKTSSKIYTNIADSDSTSTQTRSAKVKDECRTPKHSTTVTVEKCPHQKDPRLTAIVAKGSEKILLKMLKWKSIRPLDINTLDNKLVTEPISPKDKSAKSINNSSNTDHPNRPNSIRMKYRCDFKLNKSGVSDSETSQETKTIECNNSFKRDENCLRRDAKKKNIPINQKSVKKESKDNNKTKVIMNEKYVCQCNRSVIHKFCGNNFPTSKFCCHVYIKKGECDSIGKSYNRTNFLDIIDTRRSYLFPGNIHSISASNLEEHISENLQNESKQVTAFDKEQEEMEFVPETVRELTRNSTEDIVKNSADDAIVLADKIVPKKLFMQIYNTKPNKVSAAPISLDKENHKIPLNSNSEMDKKEIVLSPPKGSSTTLGNRIRKKLYDPVSDSNVCEKRLLELFDDDLRDLTSGSNRSLGDRVENVTGSKFLGESNLRRKYPFKQTSLTCDDVYVTPKKITNRRKTIYFSSFLKDTDISKNNTRAVSCPSVIGETSPSTAMTNASNHLEQLNQLETQNNTSQSTINNLSGSSKSSKCASVAAETTQLIAKEIAMTDVSNHSEKMKQVETLKNTSQDVDVSGSKIVSNFVPEANSDREQQVIVPRNENKFSKITTSPSHISPENNLEEYSARFAPENENRQMMSELLEKEVTERDTGTHKELEFCINVKDLKEEGHEYCVKIKTINSIHASTQMESESHNKNGERNVNMKISSPFGYNDVKRKKLLSMPNLDVTEHRQIKKKPLRDITELTLKFATSLEKEDECYEEVMFIYDRPSIEPSFAVSSEVSEYLVRAVFHPNNVRSSEELRANHKPATPPPSQPVPNPSDQNQSHNPINLEFYPVELGRIYYQFYDRVVYILKGYIPLQKAYSESYKVIYETFRRFPHSYNNVNQESLSLDMNIHYRRKLYSRYLLDAILKLPTDLPQFHFAHFLRMTTELLNRSRIHISIPVVVQHLLAVILACNWDYKQNKTSDKFKKNLESFSDTFNNKNGTNRPEFGMTFTQRYLLKAQILTYLQLHQNQKICSQSSKLLNHYYSRQQHYIQNASSINIQQTFGTCRNENPTNVTQYSVIQNSNQPYRSSTSMQYPNLRSILNNKSSEPPMHVVPNTRSIISSSCRQPPICTSDRNNCSVMNVTIPIPKVTIPNHPIQTNSINSVFDKIKIWKNPPVNKMTTNKQVLPNLPIINSSVPQSIIHAHSSSLQVIPLTTNSPVQSSSLQKFPSAKTFEDHSITNVQCSRELCSVNDKVNDKETDASDTTIPITKENTILVPNNCIPHKSIISNENQLENNSLSKDLPVGPSRVNQPQSVEMTTPSTSEVLQLKTQSSGIHNSVDSNADIPYTVKKEQTPVNECNIDVENGKSSDEAKKHESSDNCVDSVGTTSLDLKIKEEIVKKISFSEDEIIDLTWIDDFTEEELQKGDNGHEFMCIKNEPSVTCTEVPSSSEDSGIDSPPIQRDLDDFGPTCYSYLVEEEDFPEFFSYDC
ncbi:hypothetical protein WA026_001673 [Henosepilachna vigintioctopunctata]|uniref:Uncharacterized protein n=1 Tax=Henosepilachna vigintioctopunctata TaxID=420089 RepID=A0AAW1UR13_9CUCU